MSSSSPGGPACPGGSLVFMRRRHTLGLGPGEVGGHPLEGSTAWPEPCRLQRQVGRDGWPRALRVTETEGSLETKNQSSPSRICLGPPAPNQLNAGKEQAAHAFIASRGQPCSGRGHPPRRGLPGVPLTKTRHHPMATIFHASVSSTAGKVTPERPASRKARRPRAGEGWALIQCRDGTSGPGLL